MYIVNVIPLSPAAPPGALSYFSAKKADFGSFAEIKIRNKKIMGVVIGLSDVRLNKAALRQAAFNLRKIPKILGGECPNWLLWSANDLANYFAAPVGAILDSLLPKALITLYLEKTPEDKEGPPPADLLPEKIALQGSDKERCHYYRTLIRETFARQESIIILSPTAETLPALYEELSIGIKSYSAIVTGALGKGEWKKFAEKIAGPHPVLIVSTPAFLAIPREDLKTFVIDREARETYRQIRRPFLNFRIAAETLARHRQAKIIFGDRLLSLETHKRVLDGEITMLPGFSRAGEKVIGSAVVDMTKESRDRTSEKAVAVSRSLESLAKTAHGLGEHLFVFTVRRGLAPLVVCNDCGNAVLCRKCRVPAVLHSEAPRFLPAAGRQGAGYSAGFDKHTGETGRVLVCHRCGESRSVAFRCETCGGWRLKALGIGSERVFKGLKEILPNAPIFRLDSDTARTPAVARKITKAFYDSKGGIMVGTEKALVYLKKPVDRAAVSSLDSLFAIPDFRMNEKIAGLILALREITGKTLLIQTRNPEEPLIKDVLLGRPLAEFIKKELGERQALGYPPYGTFIKITETLPQDYAQKEAARFLNLFASWNPRIYPAFTPVVRGQAVLNCLLRLNSGAWPDEKLARILTALPFSVRVEVDPENIL